MRTAIVLGATGLTGKLLVSQLIADESYSRIKLFTRRKSDFNSSKIDKFVGDVIDLDRFKSDFIAVVVFCCFGTTGGNLNAVCARVSTGLHRTGGLPVVHVATRFCRAVGRDRAGRCRA